MNGGAESIDFDQPIPIFPLPNTVLLPCAILPLHLFEPRYRRMADDVVGSHRKIALALLTSGYEEHYHTHCAPIHDVLCVGHVVEYERLPDGRYNVLLQGMERVRIRSEITDLPYRNGFLAPLPQPKTPTSEEDAVARERVMTLLRSEAVQQIPGSSSLMEAALCTRLSASDLVDLVAFNLIGDLTCKQHFLAEPSLCARLDKLTEVIVHLACALSDSLDTPRRRRLSQSSN